VGHFHQRCSATCHREFDKSNGITFKFRKPPTEQGHLLQRKCIFLLGHISPPCSKIKRLAPTSPARFHQVANLLLCKAGGFGGSGAAITAAGAELGRSAARTFLTPLLETACHRLAHVIRSLFDLASEMVKQSTQGEPNRNGGASCWQT
jgi:hypothetical protein